MKHTPFYLAFWLGLLLLTTYPLAAVAQKITPLPSTEDSTIVIQIKKQLKKMLKEEVKKRSSVPGAILYIHAPGIDLSWGVATGFSDRKTREPLLLQQPVRLASNTKTFVAAAILRLWEEGELDLNAPITRYILDSSIETLESGGYTPKKMTVRHLLIHTSGLFDYAESQPFDKAILANPQRRWTRAEELEGTIQWGLPIDKPGKVFNYSDTGYILLGEIIEQVTEKPMALAVRELLDYKALGIKSLWWETLETMPLGLPKRAHQYWGKKDSYDWDPSFDLYGGGGLVGTVADLSLFMYGLFTGEVFNEESTLLIMLMGDTHISEKADLQTIKKYQGFGMGIRVRKISKMLAYQHSGVWGTTASYFPEIDVSIAVVATQLESKAKNKILKRASKIIRKALKH